MQKLRTSYLNASAGDKIYPRLRIAFGIYFAFTYGLGKITAGTERREGLGSAMEVFGFTGGYIIFGFLAAFVEFVGAGLISLGIGTRLMSAGLAFTMLVAILRKLTTDGNPTMAVIFGVISLFFLIFGSRELSLYKLIKKN